MLPACCILETDAMSLTVRGKLFSFRCTFHEEADVGIVHQDTMRASSLLLHCSFCSP